MQYRRSKFLRREGKFGRSTCAAPSAEVSIPGRKIRALRRVVVRRVGAEEGFGCSRMDRRAPRGCRDEEGFGRSTCATPTAVVSIPGWKFEFRVGGKKSRQGKMSL